MVINPFLLCAQNNKEMDTTTFSRKYIIGETYHYRLTLDQSQNGKWQSGMVSICELKVVKDSSGIPYDEVRWISRKLYNPIDTIDETPKAD